MKYPEEDLAQALYRDLSKRFSSTVPPTTLSIEGAGVHWHCTAKRGESVCSIACFNDPEYYTSFERDGTQIATARTSSQEDTLTAVDVWLQGHERSVLYDRFPFVDYTKRALSRIRDEVIAHAPQLSRLANVELHHHIGDIYDLRFWSQDRSCRISFYGKNELPDAFFAWDDCQLFRFQPDDSARLAEVLKRWIGDRAMPSAMRAEFPWLDVGELADYYENGNPIEGEFIQSWDGIEQVYEEMNVPFVPKVREFVAAIRRRGYDRSLRAGQSLWSLVLSRSRRHGLRPEQPCIQFWFREDGMDVYDHIDGTREDRKTFYPGIELTPKIDNLLKQLEAKPID